MTDTTARKRAEEALRESEDRFRALVTASSQVLYRMSPDWREMRQLHSQGFLATTERPNPNWLREYIHPDDQAQVRATIDEAIRTKSVFELEHRVRRADGRLGWTSSRAVPITDAKGDLVEWFGAATDITERKHAEEALRESERLQRLLADTGALAAGISEVDDLVGTVGERVARELGVSRCGFSEVDFDAGTVTVLKDYHGGLTSTAGTFPIDTFMEHWLLEGFAGRPAVIEDLAAHPLTARRYEDAFAPIRVRAHLTVPLHRGRNWVANFWASHHEARHWSARDVETMKLVAERVWSQVERMRAEESLRVANERLVEADRRKNDFLAVLSHELRNPLAPILSSVHILEHVAPGGEQASRARQVIDRQAKHMARLVEDLLDVTRISRGMVALRLEDVDLDAVARGTAEDYRETFTRNGIALEIDIAGEPLCMEGDRTRLAQVIGNLLSNSVKFTPRGGRTTLSLRAGPDGNAVLRVRDNGAGMSEETRQHLFEPFVQAPQTLERTRGGMGLGLALVKALVELHGGEVFASSDGEGKGSEFTVSLPLRAPARPRLSVVRARKLTPPARRVLVVEDNADAAESLREALELGGHELEIAYSGPEGVKAARRYKPDVVICDIGLPGLDGYGVARAIRNDPDPAVQSAYLVALSGYALEEDVEKSNQAGFDRHIAKPPSIETLEELLNDVQLEGRRRHRA